MTPTQRRNRQIQAKIDTIRAFREAEVQAAREETGDASLRYEQLPLREPVRRRHRWVA